MARSRSLGERIGARIRARRNAQGWSQAVLAEAVGVGANYIGVLERGAKVPTVETLGAIATALGCSPAALLDDGVGSGDQWLGEVVALAAAVPRGRRELLLAVLRAVVAHGST